MGRGVSGSFRSTVHCAGAGLAGWGRGVSGSFHVTVPVRFGELSQYSDSSYCAGAGLAGCGRGFSGNFRCDSSCGVSGSFRSTVTVPIVLVPGLRGVAVAFRGTFAVTVPAAFRGAFAVQ